MELCLDSPKKRTITKTKVILTEGKDAFYFMCHACNFYRPHDIEVFNYGGNDELIPFLKSFPIYGNYDIIDTIVIARDAERDTDAFASVVSSIQSVERENENLKLSVPEKSFEFSVRQNRKRCAVMIFPGPGHKEGTLEDLCLMTVQHDSIMPCVDSYLQCAQEKGEELSRKHKNRLHAFISGKNDMAGKQIGQAFQAKLFNPDHPSLEPFKRIIQQM